MGNVIVETQSFPGVGFLERLLQKTANPGAFAFEMKTLWRIINSRRCIYHILYQRYGYLDLASNLRQNLLVATIHNPQPAIDNKLRRLSAVICVGSSQAEYLAKFLSPEKVFFVPHGIDTEYFTPPPYFDERTSGLCLFVGFALRDFSTLWKVVELVKRARPGVRFVFVISPRNKTLDLFRLNQSNVEYHLNLPETELLKLYRSASVMVTPLLDTTANNAVLEALACGLPVVATDVGSIRDYLNTECAVLTPPKDAGPMAEELINLLDDRARLKVISENARHQALKFSWPDIVKQLCSVYKAIS